MKHTLLLTLIVSLFATSLLATEKEKFTPNVDDISQQLESDQILLDNEFKSLEQLEDKIKAENLTFDQLDATTIDQLALKEDVKGALVAVAGADDLPLGIPGFWWGFCLSWVGILLVVLLMEDSPDRKEQTKKAIIGALVGIGVWIVFWILFWASFAVI